MKEKLRRILLVLVGVVIYVVGYMALVLLLMEVAYR